MYKSTLSVCLPATPFVSMGG